MMTTREHHVQNGKFLNNRYILPTDNSLSLDAKGLLGVMLNCIEYDYCSREDLYHEFPKDTKRTIDNAISELCKKGYIIEFQQNCFAVNKMTLPSMKIVE